MLLMVAEQCKLLACLVQAGGCDTQRDGTAGTPGTSAAGADGAEVSQEADKASKGPDILLVRPCGYRSDCKGYLLPVLCLPPAELLAEQSSRYQRHARRYVGQSSTKHYLTPQPLEINSDVLLARQDSATQPPHEGTGDRRSREAMMTEASLGGVLGCIPLRHPTAAGWGP